MFLYSADSSGCRNSLFISNLRRKLPKWRQAFLHLPMRVSAAGLHVLSRMRSAGRAPAFYGAPSGSARHVCRQRAAGLLQKGSCWHLRTLETLSDSCSRYRVSRPHINGFPHACINSIKLSELTLQIACGSNVFTTFALNQHESSQCSNIFRWIFCGNSAIAALAGMGSGL